MSSLTQKTTSGLSWSALETIASQGLFIGIQILLARLIEPEEFGLLALCTIFIQLSQTIIDGGFSQAIIQKPEVRRVDISTVFFSNLLLSFVLSSILFLAAPEIANYFSEPRLTLLFRVLTLTLMITSVGKIQNSLLIRNLEFKILFKITTPSILLGGLVGIIMAINGFEVWSLVIAQLTSATFLTFCLWRFSKRSLWPTWEFSFLSLRTMGRFGLGILGSSLLYQGIQNVYGLIIGKAFSMEQLAYYNRARTFHRAPSSMLISVLNRVLFPVFSTIQNDDLRICKALRKGIPVIAFVTIPLMAFLMIAADQIVVILLTEKWLPAATFMRWFPIVGMVYSIAAIQLSVIRAKGRSGLLFWMNVIKGLIAIGVLGLTYSQGVLAVVIGQVVVAVATNLLINIPACQFVFGYRIKDQLADWFPYLVCTAIAAIPCVMLDSWGRLQSQWGLLVLKVLLFGLIYLAACYLFRLNGFLTVRSMAPSIIRRLIKTDRRFGKPVTDSKTELK